LDNPNRSHPIAAWWPAILWAIGIWILGSDWFSEDATSGILDPLIAWLLPDLDVEIRGLWVAGIRKLAHPGVYGLLALLCHRALNLTSRPGRSQLFIRALGPVAGLAMADEFRQALSLERTGAIQDVALDVVGGLIALLLSSALEARLGRPLYRRTPQV
jgi:hypothetical protein